MNKEECRDWFSWVPGEMRPMNAEVEPFLREQHITNDLNVRAPSRTFPRPATDAPIAARIHGTDILNNRLVERGQKTTRNSTT